MQAWSRAAPPTSPPIPRLAGKTIAKMGGGQHGYGQTQHNGNRKGETWQSIRRLPWEERGVRSYMRGSQRMRAARATQRDGFWHSMKGMARKAKGEG